MGVALPLGGEGAEPEGGRERMASASGVTLARTMGESVPPPNVL